MTVIAILAYASAIVLANLSVAVFGPLISPINAFVLIGMDLALRDWLHVRLRWWQMLLLILATGAATYLLNPAAATIAIASAISFTLAAAVDWGLFASVGGSWGRRAHTSNIGGAMVDSIVFPLLAFGAMLPHIILLQFVAKVSGGALWAWALSRTTQARQA